MRRISCVFHWTDVLAYALRMVDLRSVLMESGASVGMFISPHLETTRERISIGNDMIPEEEFVRIFEQVRRVVREDDRQCILNGQEPGSNHPSYFEFLFMMAMTYFKEKAPECLRVAQAALHSAGGGLFRAQSPHRQRPLPYFHKDGHILRL